MNALMADDLEAIDRTVEQSTALINFLIGFLQTAGALLIVSGVAMVSLAAGICVLGCLMLIFGIAIERGRNAR